MSTPNREVVKVATETERKIIAKLRADVVEAEALLSAALNGFAPADHCLFEANGSYWFRPVPEKPAQEPTS